MWKDVRKEGETKRGEKSWDLTAWGGYRGKKRRRRRDMKGSRDNLIWQCGSVLVCVHAECATSRWQSLHIVHRPCCAERDREGMGEWSCSLMHLFCRGTFMRSLHENIADFSLAKITAVLSLTWQTDRKTDRRAEGRWWELLAAFCRRDSGCKTNYFQPRWCEQARRDGEEWTAPIYHTW